MSHSRKANRRQFLSGRAAADAVGDWADARLATDENLGPPGDPTKAPYLIRFSRRAMACQFEVVLQAERDRRGQTAALEALDLVEALEALEIREQTIVFFTTDNGSTRGITAMMNGREVPGGKATLGEPGVRQPFIVSAPGRIPAGVRTDALTDFTDLLPTFAELAGTAVPDSVVIDGHSIAPLLLGKTADSPRTWIAAMGFGPAQLTPEGVAPVQAFTDRVVRDKRYKLWVLGNAYARLYDLLEDPEESNNLIESTDPQVVAARTRLEAVVASFPEQDAWPKYDPTPPQPWDVKPETAQAMSKIRPLLP